MIYLLLTFLIFWVIMCILARNGRGGILGDKIRASDWQSWKYEVERQSEKLNELYKHEPRY